MIAAIFMVLSLTLYWCVRCTAALYCRTVLPHCTAVFLKHLTCASLPACRRYVGQHSCVSYLATWMGLTPVEVGWGLRCQPPCQRALPRSSLTHSLQPC